MFWCKLILYAVNKEAFTERIYMRGSGHSDYKKICSNAFLAEGNDYRPVHCGQGGKDTDCKGYRYGLFS